MRLGIGARLGPQNLEEPRCPKYSFKITIYKYYYNKITFVNFGFIMF